MSVQKSAEAQGDGENALPDPHEPVNGVPPDAGADADAGEVAGHDEAFELLLSFLHESRGFDFTDYKRASLRRRILKRMSGVGVETFRAYMDFLEVHPEEFTELFNTILINVTSFFRDPDAWQVLRGQILPLILESKPGDEPVRVWTAACATGQETYTIAMLLAEAMGLDSFARRVKIYATDIDDDALAVARLATYDAKALEPVPAELREKYFEPQGGGRFAFRSDLRRSVIFGKHNLVQDAAISKLDLLICRNALMYFNSELQTRILRRFHFGLGDPGYLFLGRAEMLLSHTAIFTPVDIKQRIFQKVAGRALRDRVLMLAEDERRDVANRPQSPRLQRLRDLCLDLEPDAQFALDRRGTLVFVSRRAREEMGLRASDIGRPFQDLEISFRPIDIRSLVDEAIKNSRYIERPDITRALPDGTSRAYDVKVVPLMDDGRAVGVSVTFTEITRFQQLQLKLQETNHELETATEELNSSNEELETTNEELQSTVEELETTNEELQSANEEMETMNEELQASNQEMEAINNELRDRTLQLDRANTFLTSILRSLRAAVAVVDRELNVMSWSHRAEDLWGMRADEAEGRPFLDLDINLALPPLRGLIEDCLSGRDASRETVLESVNRRGKAFRCRVVVSPLLERDGDRSGAIVLMEPWEEPGGSDGDVNGNGDRAATN